MTPQTDLIAQALVGPFLDVEHGFTGRQVQRVPLVLWSHAACHVTGRERG